jgi:integrase/recombinase XerD
MSFFSNSSHLDDAVSKCRHNKYIFIRRQFLCLSVNQSVSQTDERSISTRATNQSLLRFPLVIGYAIDLYFKIKSCLEACPTKSNGSIVICTKYLIRKETNMTQAKVLSDKDVRKVLLYIASRKHANRNRAMFVLLNSTGMRVGELAALRLCDVLQSTGEIVDEIRLGAVQTKGSRGRTVVLSQKAQEEIKHYLQTRFNLKGLLAVTMTDTSRALFTTQKNPNRGFSSSTLTQHFHYIYKGAGINGASSHSSRRSFITNLANMGVSVRVLMELAGHRSMAVTQRYIDVNPSMMRKAVELLG